MTRKTRRTLVGNGACCCILVFFSVGVRTIETVSYDEERCDYNQLQTCSSTFDSVASTFDPSLPRSKEALIAICDRLSEGFSCVDRYVTECYKINHQILYQVAVRGAKSTTKHLCSNDSSSIEFLTKPNSCLRTTNFTQSNCGNFLESTTKVLNGYKDIGAEDIVRTICCSWNSFVNCKAKSVEEVCGEDESNWIRLLFQNVSGELVLSHCYGYDSNIWPGCPKATSPHHTLSLVLNQALFVVAFAYAFKCIFNLTFSPQ